MEPRGCHSRLPCRGSQRDTGLCHRSLRAEDRCRVPRGAGSQRGCAGYLDLFACRDDVVRRAAVHARNSGAAGDHQDRSGRAGRAGSAVRGHGAVQRHAGPVHRVGQGPDAVRACTAVRGAGWQRDARTRRADPRCADRHPRAGRSAGRNGLLHDRRGACRADGARAQGSGRDGGWLERVRPGERARGTVLARRGAAAGSACRCSRAGAGRQPGEFAGPPDRCCRDPCRLCRE